MGLLKAQESSEHVREPGIYGFGRTMVDVVGIELMYCFTGWPFGFLFWPKDTQHDDLTLDLRRLIHTQSIGMVLRQRFLLEPR